MHSQQQLDYNDYDYDEDDTDLYRYQDDIDSEDEFILQQNINTMRVEEIPVKEPMLNAVPKKSALKKKTSGGSGQNTPSSQDTSIRPLVVRQDNNSSSHKWVFDIILKFVFHFVFNYWIE